MRTLQRFAPTGPLALASRAFGGLFEPPTPVTTETVAGAAVVSVRGPLASRSHPTWDDYRAIVARVASALATKPSALVLVIDSPGGMAQGCIEASRELRAMCVEAGVPLLAFVEGEACSAAYALACAAERVALTSTSVVGSIGVLEMLFDQTAADAAMGVSYRMITTGARKGDFNPHVAISDGAIAAAEAATRQLGDLFFGLVEDFRGVPKGRLESLDAALVIGRAAIELGLADIECASPSQLVQTALAGVTSSNQQVKNMDKIRQDLQAIIDGDAAEEEKAQARALLAALDAAPPAQSEQSAQSKEAEQDAAASTSDSSEDSDDDADRTLAARAMAEVHRLRAEIAGREEAAERAQLLDSRPDFDPALAKLLKTAPMAMVRQMVAELPRTGNPLAASAAVRPLVGRGQGEAGGEQLPPSIAAALDVRMGITRPEYGVINVGREQHFGVPLPKKS